MTRPCPSCICWPCWLVHSSAAAWPRAAKLWRCSPKCGPECCGDIPDSLLLEKATGWWVRFGTTCFSTTELTMTYRVFYLNQSPCHWGGVRAQFKVGIAESDERWKRSNCCLIILLEAMRTVGIAVPKEVAIGSYLLAVGCVAGRGKLFFISPSLLLGSHGTRGFKTMRYPVAVGLHSDSGRTMSYSSS